MSRQLLLLLLLSAPPFHLFWVRDGRSYSSLETSSCSMLLPWWKALLALLAASFARAPGASARSVHLRDDPWSREFSDDSSCERSSDDLGAQVRDSAKSCPCICTVTFPQKEKGKNRRAVTRSGPISATCVVRPGGRAANGGGEKDRASGRTAGPLGTAGPTVSRPGARQAQGACGEAPAGGRPH